MRSPRKDINYLDMRILMTSVVAMLATTALLACGAPSSLGSATPSIPISRCPVGAGAAVRHFSPAPAHEASSGGRSTSPPRVSPSELIACVGTNQISGATFDHWLRIFWLEARPRTRLRELPALTADALNFLLQVQWITGEAEALGITINPRALHRRYVHLRNQQFPHGRGFETFLHSSHQTISDTMLRIRIQMLSSSTLVHVLAGKHGKQRTRALAKFVRQFKLHWQAQTYCQAHFETPLCGHTPPQG
jgi:hypothetical protein